MTAAELLPGIILAALIVHSVRYLGRRHARQDLLLNHGLWFR